MRRSIRDAIIGFSLLGGIGIFAGSILWIRGVKINSNSWQVNVNFEDASGLAEMSPVTYRGIIIGSIKKIIFKTNYVQTKVQINDGDLILRKPVTAKIVTSSVLGGDAQLSFSSIGKTSEKSNSKPTSKNCNSKLILCNDDFIKGEKLTSISSITESFDKVLQQADQEKIVDSMAMSMKQFDQTQANLDELVELTKSEIIRAQPIITELTEAASHLNSILATIDNPETLKDIKEVAGSTNAITKRLNRLGGKLEKTMKDRELMQALRKITIGLSKLFNELYK